MLWKRLRLSTVTYPLSLLVLGKVLTTTVFAVIVLRIVHAKVRGAMSQATFFESAVETIMTFITIFLERLTIWKTFNQLIRLLEFLKDFDAVQPTTIVNRMIHSVAANVVITKEATVRELQFIVGLSPLVADLAD